MIGSVHDRVVFWISRPFVTCLFSILSGRKARQVKTCFPPLPLYMFIGGALLTPSPRPFLLSLCPSSSNFEGSLATEVLGIDQSRRSSFFMSPTELLCFLILKPPILLYYEPFYFFKYNSMWRLHKIVKQNSVKVFSATGWQHIFDAYNFRSLVKLRWNLWWHGVIKVISLNGLRDIS